MFYFKEMAISFNRNLDAPFVATQLIVYQTLFQIFHQSAKLSTKNPPFSSLSAPSDNRHIHTCIVENDPFLLHHNLIVLQQKFTKPSSHPPPAIPVV